MTTIINFTLPKLQTQPKVLALYVDDSLWIIDKQAGKQAFDILNSFHPKIKFTLEEESSEGINFLDITITRLNGQPITNWYKKPFASFRLLNYYSSHNKTCIRETCKAFVRSVLNLSHESLFAANKHLLIDILRVNNIPETDILTIMHHNYTLMRTPPKRSPFKGNYLQIKSVDS